MWGEWGVWRGAVAPLRTRSSRFVLVLQADGQKLVEVKGASSARRIIEYQNRKHETIELVMLGCVQKYFKQKNHTRLLLKSLVAFPNDHRRSTISAQIAFLQNLNSVHQATLAVAKTPMEKVLELGRFEIILTRTA